MICNKDRREVAAQKTDQEVGVDIRTPSNVSGHQNTLEGLLKHRPPGPTPTF